MAGIPLMYQATQDPQRRRQPTLVQLMRQEFEAAGSGPRGTGAAIRTGIGGVTAGAVEAVTKPARAVGGTAAEFGKGLLGIEDEAPALATPGSPPVTQGTPPSATPPRTPVTPIPLATRLMNRQLKEGEGYIVGEGGRVVSNIPDVGSPGSRGGTLSVVGMGLSPEDTLASLQRKIAAYQDLGEAREAASIGLTPEQYRAKKRQDVMEGLVAKFMTAGHSRTRAITLAAQEREAALREAGLMDERANAVLQRQQAELDLGQRRTLADMLRRASELPDGPRRDALIDVVLAAQGKAPNAERYVTLRGGQEPYTDPTTGQILMRNLPDALFDTRSGNAVGRGAGPVSTAAQQVPPDGVYDVPGYGRVTVRGGRAYDEDGNPIDDRTEQEAFASEAVAGR